MSRSSGLGEPGLERRASGAAALLVMTMACGFVDGDPIVAGDTVPATASTDGAPATGDGSTTGGSTTGDAGSSGPVDGSGDSTGVTIPCPCEGRAPGERCLRLVNACDRTIWAGATGDTPAGVLAVDSMLAPGECLSVTTAEVTGGRAFGRTDCVDDVCASDGGMGQGTLVQFSLPAEGTDLYNVSLVDGFNLPMAMSPAGVDSASAEPGTCEPAVCAADLNVVCPPELSRYDEGGTLAYCTSACRACGECPGCSDCGDPGAPACDPCAGLADLCCGDQACEASEYTMLWTSLCPDAITYAGQSSLACSEGSDYDIVYCP